LRRELEIVSQREVVCVPRPALYPVDGEFQGVAWAKGETYNLRDRLMNNSLA
jgi:hypothetical protein